MHHKILFLFLSLFLVVPPATAHDYHVSVADVRFNAKTQMLEIALRVFTDDLENALTQRQKKTVKFSQSEEVKQQIHAYLQDRLQLKDAAGKIFPIKLLGYEEEDDAVWMYIEASVQAKTLPKLRIKNAVLTELFDDQMNMVNFEVNGRKTSVILNQGTPEKLVTF